STTPALPSDRLTQENNPTALGHPASGSISTQGMANHMPPQPMQPSLFTSSAKSRGYLSRCTLAQVVVSISIGRWRRSSILVNGAAIPKGSEVFVSKRVCRLMRFELAIWHLYFEPPEPTTERMGRNLSEWEI